LGSFGSLHEISTILAILEMPGSLPEGTAGALV
jgi:hypothetical protein